MRIIKICAIGIGAILLESILCVAKLLAFVIRRVAAVFSMLFLFSAVVALIQDGAITYMAGASMLGFVLCMAIPFLFQFMITGVELLGEKMLA